MVGHPVRLACDARADCNRPERQLIPGQQVSREAQDQSQHHQNDADHPIKLARRLVRTRVKDTTHVEEEHQNHRVRRPEVHPAQDVAERDRGMKVEHPIVGVCGGRHVDEHQHDAGNRQQYKQIH